ncbi:MAG: MFS transporter, partial [Chloroflexota bacterium]|nr:MFS transporter [Chloroflexota bacterium]
MKARSPRAALAAVVAEGFLGRLAFGMLSFAFPLYARSLGLSLTEIGVLVSLRSIVVLPLKPGAGWLADAIGIRAVYLLALLVRTISAVWMLIAGDFLSLAGVRLLHGVSAAGRDVGSLGVVVRDAEAQVGTAYSWYATAKHLGSVAGAGLAGLIIAASGQTFTPLWLTILVLSILPLVAAWFGLREAPAAVTSERGAEAPAEPTDVGDTARGGLAETAALLREIAGPATVGMLVAASAYMVHGIFPVLATEYAGLSAAQAGWIYTLSAVVFLVAGPLFGWLSDRYGRVVGLAARSAANIGSSLLYLVSPTFPGILAARAVDDAGKAAFKPAWASAIAEVAKADERRRGRRIGALDTAETAGEVIGPALAGFLWQTGGIVALFGARILIAIMAELTAMKVFGEARHHLRPSPRLTALSYLAPPALALAGVAAWLGAVM